MKFRQSVSVMAVMLLAFSVEAIAQRGFAGDSDSASSKTMITEGKEPIRYPLKGVDKNSESFKKILQLVREVEALEKRKKKISYKVLQTISPGKYLSYIYVGDPSREETRNILLITGNKEVVADGTKLLLQASPTGETFEYTTVLGATSIIAVYKAESEDDKEITDLEFIEKLKGGEKFVVKMKLSPQNCKTCAGSGRVTADKKYNKEKDGKMSCSECRGVGKVTIIQPYELCWEK